MSKETTTPNVLQKILKRVLGVSTLTILGAIAASLLIGALIVVIFDHDVQIAAASLSTNPGAFFSEVANSFQGFFTSLFRGAIYDYQSNNPVRAIKPIFETLTRSVPLVIAGLAITVAFRAGLFNIGVQGQLAMGAIFATFAGLHLPLPYGIHLLVAILFAIVGGMLWGAIPGFLKAHLGANEVIVTIMMNAVTIQLLAFLLKTETFIGDGTPGKSQPIEATAGYPRLFGDVLRLDLSIIVALLAVVFVWWLLERSTFGFELRASGANPDAARTAGMSVTRVIMITMAISGALAGLAATAPVLGTERFLANSTAGSFGFDAITVALLGKATPVGTLLAGILFGALAAGAATMQASAGIPVDIVQITQAVIVLLIAASEAVRYYREKRKVAQAATATTVKGEGK